MLESKNDLSNSAIGNSLNSVVMEPTTVPFKLSCYAKPFVPARVINVSGDYGICNTELSNAISLDYFPQHYDKSRLNDDDNDTMSTLNNEFDDRDAYSVLNDFRIKNINKILIANLNINSLRNKINMLSDIIVDKIDILLITESKLDDSFPSSSFKIPGFSNPFRRDRSCFGGGIVLYTRSDIPSTLLTSVSLPEHVECVFIEIRLGKVKWLLGNFYNPCKNQISSNLHYLSIAIDHYFPQYDNILILGDFNSEMSEVPMIIFCESYNLKNLVKAPTCFKNPEKPSCIDLMLTNRYRSFTNTVVVETGLSDFHRMTLTALKTSFRKKTPNILAYRDYKKFSNELFQHDLKIRLQYYDVNNISFDLLNENIMLVVNKHLPIKYKYIRANQGVFMNKELRKAIMIRSKLKNKFVKTNTEVDKISYKRQRNFCANLVRKTKIAYFNNLNPSSITDNKAFWKTVRPAFTDKKCSHDDIILIDNENIISDDKQVANTFSDFFANSVQELKISFNPDLISDDCNSDDAIMKACFKFEKHPSIMKIRDIHSSSPSFSFKCISLEDMNKEIKSLDVSKATPIDSIPVRILKENSDLPDILHNNFNNSITSCVFPDTLKLADVSPIYKKGGRNDKFNYRPVSILPAISKIYERLLFYQINDFFESKLSQFQCGFRKGYSAQYCLIRMVERWKRCIDKGGASGALLTDLSKAFDCISHDLLIAKLNAYGFSYDSLKLIHSYLSVRKQRIRINSQYSLWSEIISGVPQGSILGPLIFNIDMADLFLFMDESDIANYADDNTPYALGKDIISVISKLENDSMLLFNWLGNNALKANPNKSHLILSSRDTSLMASINGIIVPNENNVNLLGITIDNELNFDKHVSNLCKQASKKLHALSRIARYIDLDKRKVLMNSFFLSQFNYCPLIWMCHSRRLNNRINRLHERSLRIVYSDDISTYEELLSRDQSFTIHERNIKYLAIELFKVKNGIAPNFMNEIFTLNENNRYCSKQIFVTNNVRTVNNGTETLSYLGPKIWLILPDDIKMSNSLTEFKNKVRHWKPKGCPCRLCKVYINQVGFIGSVT